MMRLVALLIAACVGLSSAALPVSALGPVEAENKGLYISPLRNYLTLNAGESVTRAFTVANLTDTPMDISTHIERFSVVDYNYDYEFGTATNDWVAIKQQTFSLKPYESREVTYSVTLPDSATPGGYYYTLYAASTVTSGATNTTLRAATLLYLTVNGTLKRTSVVTSHSLPFLVISPRVEYTLAIKNTGNVHYFAQLSSAVDGLFYHNAPNGTSQLLMPSKIRQLDASIATPVIPGIYKLTYTITPDDGVGYAESRYFLYAPLWFIILIGFLLAYGTYYVRKRRSKQVSESE